jgi:muramoyltetrapeptide carboxypeptidase LdcA involved in peptidoglycan recycling
MAETKAIIKSADMSEEMQQEAVDCGTQALEKYNIEKDIAAHIKREFDKKYGKKKTLFFCFMHLYQTPGISFSKCIWFF